MEHAALLTDGDAMARPLLQRLAGDGNTRWGVDECRVVQTRRHAAHTAPGDLGAWLDVCYRLALQDRDRGTRHALWLYAKAYSQGQSADAFRAALPAACVIPGLGEPVMHMPELDLVVWPLPNDPVMDQLPALLDPVAVRPHLPPAAMGREGSGGIGEISVVRYEPEDHCLARIAIPDAANEAAIYGKSYAGEQWRDARDCMHALWCTGCVDPQAFVVGRPLGSCPALHTVWQAEVCGEPIALRLAGPHAEAMLDAVAAALAALHAGPPIARETHPVAATVTQARTWCSELTAEGSRFAADLDALLFHLERGAAPPRRVVTVHGDFHAGRMQWWNGRIALFDYDSFTIDSPARDVASFVGDLLCRDDDSADWARLAACFVARYRAHCGGRLAESELEWHLQFALLRDAYRCFLHQRAGWQERALRALTIARSGIATLPHLGGSFL
ncbi:Phosphotransferase enzyme family protein [Azoarcus sp. Aa7]|nr:Phosphotransferase enzyme family protein [Azoarcus sp. Aa7]